jgi:hypothetical protein
MLAMIIKHIRVFISFLSNFCLVGFALQEIPTNIKLTVRGSSIGFMTELSSD